MGASQSNVLNDEQIKNDYEQKLLKYIKENKPVPTSFFFDALSDEVKLKINPDIVKQIIEKNPKVIDGNMHYVYGKTSIYRQLIKKYSDNIDLISFSIDKGGIKNFIDSDFKFILLNLSNQNYVNIMKLLIEKGLDVDDTLIFRSYGSGPISGNTEYLLLKEILININNYKYIINLLYNEFIEIGTISTYIIASNNYDLIKFIMEKSKKPKLNKGLLIFPVIHRNPELLTYLIENGVTDVNTQTHSGQTALILAVRLNQPNIVNILLKQNADKTISDITGKTAYDYAISEDMRKLVKIEENLIKPVITIESLDDDTDSSLNQRFQSENGMKPKFKLVNYNGKEYKITFVTIPSETLLYRGVRKECGAVELYLDRSFSFLFFSQFLQDAKIYSKGSCILTYKVKKDIILLDLWNENTIGFIMDVLNQFNVSQKELLLNFFGLNLEGPYNFKKSIELRYDDVKDPYFDGKFMEDRIVYRGLSWGPLKNQYKRFSRYNTDSIAYSYILSIFKEIDGIFSPVLPSFYDSFQLFHSEVVILNKAYKDKIEFVSKVVGGKRRKTYRSKKNCRTKGRR